MRNFQRLFELHLRSSTQAGTAVKKIHFLKQNKMESPVEQIRNRGLSCTALPKEVKKLIRRTKDDAAPVKASMLKRRASLHNLGRKFSVPLFGRIRAKSGEDEHATDSANAPEFDYQRNTVTMHDRVCEAALIKLYDENTENAEIFERVMRPLCDEVLEGFNTLIFAYGQTGTGKTYTLLGKKRLGVKGMLPRAIEYFLTAAGSSENKIKVELCAVEVYGTSANKILVYDLLHDQNHGCDWESKKGLSGFDIKSITRKPLTIGDWDSLINKAFEASHYAPTAKNPVSTRGHVTWIIELEIISEEESTSKKSHMLVLDLAGSEGATALTPEFIKQVSKDVAEIRRREAGVINHGLMQLARIFKEIRMKGVPSSTVSNGLRRVIHGFINRNMCIRGIFTLSPYGLDSVSTYNTVKFINDVEKIRLKPKLSKQKVNIKSQNQKLRLRLKCLEDQIRELQIKLKRMKLRYQQQERLKRTKEENDEVTDRLMALGQMRVQLSDPTSHRGSVSQGFKQIQMLVKMQQKFRAMDSEPSGKSRWKVIRETVNDDHDGSKSIATTTSLTFEFAPNLDEAVQPVLVLTPPMERRHTDPTKLAKLLDNYQEGHAPDYFRDEESHNEMLSHNEATLEQITEKLNELKEENFLLQRSNAKLATTLRMASAELKKKTDAMEKLQASMEYLKMEKANMEDLETNTQQKHDKNMDHDILQNMDHDILQKLDVVEHSLMNQLETQKDAIESWTKSIREELFDMKWKQQTPKWQTLSQAPYATLEADKQKEKLKKMLEDLSDTIATSFKNKEKRFQLIFERSQAAFGKVLRALLLCNDAKKSAIRSKEVFIRKSSQEIERLRHEFLKLTGSPRKTSKFYS